MKIQKLSQGVNPQLVKNVGVTSVSEDNQLKILTGCQTSLIKDVTDSEGCKKDVVILARIENGQELFYIKTKEDKPFVVPDKIAGNTLAKEEQEILTKGGVIGPYEIGNNKYFVQYNSDLNDIVYNNVNDYKLPSIIDNYNVSDLDKLILINGLDTLYKEFENNGIKYKAKLSLDDKGLLIVRQAYKKPFIDLKNNNIETKQEVLSKIKSKEVLKPKAPVTTLDITDQKKILLLIENNVKNTHSSLPLEERIASLNNALNQLTHLKTAENIDMSQSLDTKEIRINISEADKLVDVAKLNTKEKESELSNKNTNKLSR